jgi:predicted ATPase
VTAQAGLSTRQALVEFLRGKQLLLVLDNCEHLLEGAAALAGVLQRACERLVILATSREGLGIEGERLVPVPPLAVPAPTPTWWGSARPRRCDCSPNARPRSSQSSS